MPARALSIVVVFALAAAGAPRVAHADDRAAAKAEFQAGLDADKRKDYASAIAHYQRAYELAPHENALFNIAVDFERLGELRDAATYYGRYLDDAGDTEDRAKVTRLIDSLRKRPSQVSIRSSPPGAEISIDGSPAGRAPVTRELAGGTHTITAVLGELRSQRQISVEYAEPADVVLSLAGKDGSLTVTSNVDGAQVTIDGAPAGTTPLTIAVPAGDRKVVVHSEGYSTLERLVKVPSEGSAQITATLVRPIGYVAPPDPAKQRGYVLSVGGGPLIQADTNLVSAGVGYRILNWELGWLFGFYGEKRYAYGLQLRRYLGTSRLKPYVGVYGQYGSTSGTSSGRIGVLGAHFGIAFEIMSGERYDLELTVDGGASSFSDGDNRDLVFPILASLQVRGGGR
jgi:hypothetical protein